MEGTDEGSVGGSEGAVAILFADTFFCLIGVEDGVPIVKDVEIAAGVLCALRSFCPLDFEGIFGTLSAIPAGIFCLLPTFFMVALEISMNPSSSTEAAAAAVARLLDRLKLDWLVEMLRELFLR